MECEYKILLERVSDLLGSRIYFEQINDPEKLGICKVCEYENQNIDNILAGLKDKVVDIWQAYRNYHVQVNYTDRYIRAAYMLSYFPYYINPIYYVLNKQNIPNIKGELNVGFLGGGALPELVGLSKYVALHRKRVKNINATVFDFTNHWDTERRLITEPLVKNYYKGNYTIDAIKTNLWDKEFIVHNSIEKLDIIILQNTINEATDEELEIFKNNLIEIWNKLSRGTDFIIIDLKYTEIFNFINDFTKSINNKKILIELNEELIDSSLPKCYFIQEKLFDKKESGLFPRSGTRQYYHIVLQKR